jgi:hypothetical protein
MGNLFAHPAKLFSPAIHGRVLVAKFIIKGLHITFPQCYNPHATNDGAAAVIRRPIVARSRTPKAEVIA